MQFTGDRDEIDINIDPSTSTNDLRVISKGTGNRLTIGANCRIASHIFLANGATLQIGDRVTATGSIAFHLHEGSHVSIGDGCLFSQQISFRPSDAHKIFDIATGLRINEPRPILIGNKVWVGEQVLFLKGAEVADGSVVGARSTVSAVFEEPNVLIVGTPARVLRHGIRWEA